MYANLSQEEFGGRPCDLGKGLTFPWLLFFLIPFECGYCQGQLGASLFCILRAEQVLSTHASSGWPAGG